MHAHRTHDEHAHGHGIDCGHVALEHAGHVDYLHDGHLHRAHGDHFDECHLEVNEAFPDRCDPTHACRAHHDAHRHGPGCGHEAVPHGDHVDYLVGDHLHRAHQDHCDDHGHVKTA